MITVKLSPGMGRGVFATQQIVAGSLIDVTPTWPLSPADLVHFENMSIAGHWFDHPERPGHGLLALGALSLVNHSPTPNAKVIFEKRDIGYVGVLTALHQIEYDEQVQIDYQTLPDRMCASR